MEVDGNCFVAEKCLKEMETLGMFEGVKGELRFGLMCWGEECDACGWQVGVCGSGLFEKSASGLLVLKQILGVSNSQ